LFRFRVAAAFFADALRFACVLRRFAVDLFADLRFVAALHFFTAALN
jgi:hypothetical protein